MGHGLTSLSSEEVRERQRKISFAPQSRTYFDYPNFRFSFLQSRNTFLILFQEFLHPAPQLVEVIGQLGSVPVVNPSGNTNNGAVSCPLGCSALSSTLEHGYSSQGPLTV